MKESSIEPVPARCAPAPADGVVRQIIARYDGQREMLIPILQDLQAARGYLPAQDLGELARALETPLSEIYSIATFYAAFRLQPRGEHLVSLCMGTVCYLKGADKISAAIQEEFRVAAGGTSPDGKLSFAPLNCLGACALAPVMVVDGEYHGGLSVGSALEILRKTTAGGTTAGATAQPILMSGTERECCNCAVK